MNEIQKPAQTSVEISDLVANRWSPRVYDPSHTITENEILRLAEAARWAPSGNNNQPWRFVFIARENQLFSSISNEALTGFNQSWAPKASLYVVAIANKHKPDGSEYKQHDSYFNNALATTQIVFEAEVMGLKAHYMGGISHDKVAELLGVQDGWISCILTVGKQGDVAKVSEELKEREQAARVRKDFAEIAEIML